MNNLTTPMRDMLVVIPGITGSELTKRGHTVWGTSITALRAGADELIYDPREPDDGVEASRILRIPQIIAGLMKVDGYGKIVNMLTRSFTTVQGHPDKPSNPYANLYEFPYDWRIDNRIAAKRLAAFIRRELPRLRERTGAADAKVILVTHSMGGLIGRYYLEVLGGFTDCRMLITLGTPYSGSAKMMDFLANGYRLPLVDLTDVMKSCPAVYQLLPTYRAVQEAGTYRTPLDTDWGCRLNNTGFADALQFHREIRDAVKSHALSKPAYVMVAVVGTKQRTVQTVEVSPGGLQPKYALPAEVPLDASDGDGSVPYLSATPPEQEIPHALFFPERHSSLHANEEILEQIRAIIAQSQTRMWLGQILGPRPTRQAAISLDVDDVYLSEEPVVLTARLVDVQGEPVRLEAHITAIGNGRADGDHTFSFDRADDQWRAQIPHLDPGAYRVSVRAIGLGRETPPAVHDFFTVTG